MNRPRTNCSTVMCSQSWHNLPMLSNPIQSNSTSPPTTVTAHGEDNVLRGLVNLGSVAAFWMWGLPATSLYDAEALRYWELAQCTNLKRGVMRKEGKEKKSAEEPHFEEQRNFFVHDHQTRPPWPLQFLRRGSSTVYGKASCLWILYACKCAVTNLLLTTACLTSYPTYKLFVNPRFVTPVLCCANRS